MTKTKEIDMTKTRDDIIEEKDDGGTGCVCSATGGKWIRIDQSARYERLIKELPSELQSEAREGRVALRLPSKQRPSKPEGQDV